MSASKASTTSTFIDADTTQLAELRTLLDKNRHTFHVEFRGFLSNHMSHYLIALYHLGASAKMLDHFYKRYVDANGLEPRIPSQSRISDQNWRDFLGDKLHYSDYVEYFNNELKASDLKTVVNKYMPILIEGVIGSALHPIITLGLSLTVEDIAGVADGLAYLCYASKNMGKIVEGKRHVIDIKSVVDILNEVRQDPAFDSFPLEGGFQTKVTRILSQPFLGAIAKYDILIDNSKSVEEHIKLFAGATVEAFTFTGEKDFFLLHGVTSFFALKQLLPYLEQQHQLKALSYFWRALICDYVLQHRKPLSPPSVQPYSNEWQAIVSEAEKCNDVHLVKLVYVCHEYAREYGNCSPVDFKSTAGATVSAFEQNKKDWVYN